MLTLLLTDPTLHHNLTSRGDNPKEA